MSSSSTVFSFWADGGEVLEYLGNFPTISWDAVAAGKASNCPKLSSSLLLCCIASSPEGLPKSPNMTCSSPSCCCSAAIAGRLLVPRGGGGISPIAAPSMVVGTALASKSPNCSSAFMLSFPSGFSVVSLLSVKSPKPMSSSSLCLLPTEKLLTEPSRAKPSAPADISSPTAAGATACCVWKDDSGVSSFELENASNKSLAIPPPSPMVSLIP
mmetsp:Transcript_6430/g.14503  ORF Transcript_6430/g.14503 Transcript_6430/m.14503 type:complete len:213 (-) Transcript_6430:1728-2366(-)